MPEKTPQKYVSLEDYMKLADEYDRLRQIYDKLKTKHVQCGFYLDEAIKKYEGARNVARQWFEWQKKYGDELQNFIDARKAAKPKVLGDERDEGHVTSSQTTEGEQAFLRQEDTASCSDDEPEVVSARSLKRKRRKSIGSVQSSVGTKVEPTTPTEPVELASEDYSSPVLRRSKLVRAETSDLDAHVQHMTTPRKHEKARAQSEEVARPRNLSTAISSLSEGNSPDCRDDTTTIQTESTDVTTTLNVVKTCDSSPQNKGQKPGNNVLRQRSVNIPSPSNNGSIRSTLQHKRNPALASLAEDGDDHMSQNVIRKNTPGQQRRRLDTLLDVPSPARHALTGRISPNPTREPQEVKKVQPEVKTKPNQESLVKPILATKERIYGFEEPPPPPQPEDEPLRARPLKMLCLDDFKINPNYLGSNYAFADTFRGREQRRCLAGCTRPECCGNSFKKAVEAGMIKSTKTDDEVLEGYLGPDWRTHMYTYGPEKRKELLVQARAYAFASEHGKHRDAFARRSTPPGFWRIDMPTTQEEEQDRARAISLERERVEDRWREAMRGGRWIFRDER